MNSYKTIDLSLLEADQFNLTTNDGATYCFVGSSNQLLEIEVAQNCSALLLDLSCGGNFKVALNRDSRFSLVSVKTCSSTNNYTIDILGSGVDCELRGVSVAKNSDSIELYTTINHYKGGSESRQLFKSVGCDNSKTLFEGKIHIVKDAQQTVSLQQNKNLLLSKNAQVLSRPWLEIYADDVKCTHGSTTGMLSEEEIFYMRQRGIPLPVARQLQLEGFTLEVIEKIENDLLREEVSQKLLTAFSAQ